MNRNLPINPERPPCANDGCRNSTPPVSIFSNQPVFQIIGCNCHICPTICHPCRSMYNNVRCKFCGAFGDTKTVKKAGPNVVGPIIGWRELRNRRIKKTSRIDAMANSWFKFTRYWVLPKTMTGFKNWLRLQVQKKGVVTRVCSSTELQTLQVLNMKQATFARMLLYKMSPDANDDTRFLESDVWQKRLIALIMRRFISNVAAWHML